MQLNADTRKYINSGFELTTRLNSAAYHTAPEAQHDRLYGAKNQIAGTLLTLIADGALTTGKDGDVTLTHYKSDEHPNLDILKVQNNETGHAFHIPTSMLNDKTRNKLLVNAVDETRDRKRKSHHPKLHTMNIDDLLLATENNEIYQTGEALASSVYVEPEKAIAHSLDGLGEALDKQMAALKDKLMGHHKVGRAFTPAASATGRLEAQRDSQVVQGPSL